VNRNTLRRASVPAALALTFLVTACGGGNEAEAGGGANGEAKLSGEILIDGSSTVAPLSSAAGELFKEEESGVNVSVQTSGTGGGFKKFCEGQTTISNASRPIKDEEKKLCADKGVEYVEIVVANDALTVVTNKENTFLDCLTTDELKKLWDPAATGKVTKWNQVNAKFPAEEIKLYGPGTDSGTFDYFTDEINGEEGASRTDYEPSEDDNVIVQGVSGDKNALGYFGYTYFEENADKLKAVKVDGGDGCVTPSEETARDGSYKPLSRPLFIYVAKKDWTRPEVKAFVNFYVDNDADIAKAAKYIPLNEEQKTKAKQEVASLG
jgi:phosphate transport system substrate-binding protein